MQIAPRNCINWPLCQCVVPGVPPRSKSRFVYVCVQGCVKKPSTVKIVARSDREVAKMAAKETAPARLGKSAANETQATIQALARSKICWDVVNDDCYKKYGVYRRRYYYGLTTEEKRPINSIPDFARPKHLNKSLRSLAHFKGELQASMIERHNFHTYMIVTSRREMMTWISQRAESFGSLGLRKNAHDAFNQLQERFQNAYSEQFTKKNLEEVDIEEFINAVTEGISSALIQKLPEDPNLAAGASFDSGDSGDSENSGDSEDIGDSGDSGTVRKNGKEDERKGKRRRLSEW